MRIMMKIWMVVMAVGVLWGCKEKNTSNRHEVERKVQKVVVNEPIARKGVDGKNWDVFIPEHDYELDKKIRKAVSNLIDTNKIYQIYQYENHNVVHVLDRQDRSKTGIIYVSKDLQKANFIRMLDRNPYSCDFPSDTTYFALPVYDVRGISRKEIETKIPNVIWDNKGDPTHIYTRSVISNFAATNKARGYNFSIIGTEGPMAVQSKLYIENNRGKYLDSIEYIGSEIWHPAITDDGRFVAYLHGRAFPKEGGGKVIQHFTIYDLQKKEHIFEIKDFVQDGSRIGFLGNFFYFSLWNKAGINYYYVVAPHKQAFYRIPTQRMIDIGAGAFKHDGVYAHPHDPPSLRLLSWEKDFEVIPFNQYKQK